MNKKKVNWILLAMVVTIMLVLLAHSVAPPVKPRAQRISSVNRIASVSWTLPSTNAPPAIFQSK